MPIIKPIDQQRKEACRIKLDAGTVDKIRQYCEWSGVKKLDEFFQQAAEFVFTKDKEWLKHANEECTSGNGD